jgi:sec-independent protein translocase protein TatA
MFEGILQPAHLLLIVAIAMILFGPKKIPELGRGLGEAIRGFRDAFNAPPERPAEPVKPQQEQPKITE